MKINIHKTFHIFLFLETASSTLIILHTLNIEFDNQFFLRKLLNNEECYLNLNIHRAFHNLFWKRHSSTLIKMHNFF